MYEELIKALHGWNVYGQHLERCNCELAAANAIESLTAQAAALQAENAELKQRVEAKEAILRLYEPTLSLVSGDKDTAIHRMRKAEAALSRLVAERDTLLKGLEEK